MSEVFDALARLGAAALYRPEGAQQLSLLRVPAGQAICRSGEAVRALLLLSEGRVNVLSISAEGQYGSISHSEPPRLLGDIEFFNGKPFLHTVVTEKDAVFVRFPMDYVNQYLSDSAEFYRYLCRNLMDKLYSTSFSYSRALTQPAKNRLAGWILAHAAPDGTVRIVGIQAAEDIGITPRHVSRLLGALEAEGLLCRCAAKTFRIPDPPTLRRRAEGE